MLCALDPEPATLEPEKLEIFQHLAELIGYQLEQDEQLTQRDARLVDAAATAKLREQLLGIVSHDLRNPLSTILLAAGTLMRRPELDERSRRGLLRILEAANRANRLIRDLLDFTQVRMGQQRLPVNAAPMNVHALAEQVVDELRAEVPQRSFSLEATGDGAGQWDSDRLAQVLVNLVTNAIQYSPADATITVRTAGDAAGVSLEVHNAGPPIPAAVLPTLFEPMSRGHVEGSERRSVGLGLFIVDQVARSHGGAVSVHSDASSGTRFTVALPRRTPPADDRS